MVQLLIASGHGRTWRAHRCAAQKAPSGGSIRISRCQGRASTR